MFKRRTTKATSESSIRSADPADVAPNATALKGRRKINWLKVSVIANVAILIVVAGVATGAKVIHESNTNPNFCANCHVMESHVDSYLNKANLDNLHAQAGVGCKDCHHDYSLSDEITAGIKFVTGNYDRDEDGEVAPREFDDEMCLQCHISQPYMERQTDYLYYNPHFTRMGIFTCTTCHLSHEEQVNFCNECHFNPDQRMLGDMTPRKSQLGENIPYSPHLGF